MASGNRNYNIATETTQQEMLEMLEMLKSVNRNYTHLIYGSFNNSEGNSTTPITIEGKGNITFWSVNTNVGKLCIKVDGSEFVENIPVGKGANFNVSFNSKVSFYNVQSSGYEISYVAQYEDI